MIRRIKRALKATVRVCIRQVRRVESDPGALDCHLDCLIREIARLHARMDLLEELIRQTHAPQDNFEAAAHSPEPFDDTTRLNPAA
jgi:hypothetical protein